MELRLAWIVYFSFMIILPFAFVEAVCGWIRWGNPILQKRFLTDARSRRGEEADFGPKNAGLFRLLPSAATGLGRALAASSPDISHLGRASH